jgi:hypothetical protein
MNDLKTGWKLRINQPVSNADYVDFSPNFNSNFVAIIATTTNVNPRNVVGYLYQILDIPLIGKCEINERFTIINKFPKLIIFPSLDTPYTLRFRFADPIGKCVVKIWEKL